MNIFFNVDPDSGVSHRVLSPYSGSKSVGSETSVLAGRPSDPQKRPKKLLPCPDRTTAVRFSPEDGGRRYLRNIGIGSLSLFLMAQKVLKMSACNVSQGESQ